MCDPLLILATEVIRNDMICEKDAIDRKNTALVHLELALRELVVLENYWLERKSTKTLNYVRTIKLNCKMLIEKLNHIGKPLTGCDVAWLGGIEFRKIVVPKPTNRQVLQNYIHARNNVKGLLVDVRGYLM